MTAYAIRELDRRTHTWATITDHAYGKLLDLNAARVELANVERYIGDGDNNLYLTASPIVDLTCDTASAGAEGHYGGELYRIAEDPLPVAVLHYTSAAIANPSDGRGGWRPNRVVLILHDHGVR